MKLMVPDEDRPLELSEISSLTRKWHRDIPTCLVSWSSLTDHFCPSLDRRTYHPQQHIHLEVEVEFVESIPPSSWDLLLQSDSTGIGASECRVEGLSI